MNDILICRQSLLHKICIYIFAVWCAVLAALNIYELFNGRINIIVIVSAVLAAAVSVIVSWLLAKPLSKLKGIKLVLVLYAVSLALKLFIVFTIAPEDFSDFWTFRMGAASIARGDVSFVTRLPYYSIWAYQFGFEWLTAPFFKLFGQSSSQFGIILNAFFAAGCTPLLYGIGKSFLSRRNALTAAMIFTLLPITINLSAVFTNQQISLLFILLACYAAMKKPDPIGGAIAGLCLCVAKIARPDEIVYIAAIIVAVLLLKRAKKSFLTVICMLIVYFACFKFAEYLVSPLQPFGLGNNYPLYKFAVGLNEASFGAFSKEVSLATFENEAFILDHELRDAETMKMIQADLAIGPARLLRFFTYKTRIQWTGLWHQFEMLHDIAAAEKLVVFGHSFSYQLIQNLCAKWDCAVRVILFAAAAAGGFISARRRDIHMAASVFMLAFMAFSAIAMLIEVQYRYSYFVFPAIVFAAMIPFDKKKE